MGFVCLNTALKVPDSVAERAIELSREVARDNKPKFVLDGVEFHPHITVYSPEYPESRTEDVLRGVEEIAGDTNQIKLRYKEQASERGFIGIRFELTRELQSLHEALIHEINPLRVGHLGEVYIKTDSDYDMKFSAEQQKEIEEYGHPAVMDSYDPHVTIIRLEDKEDAEDIAGSLKWDIEESVVQKLAVYTMGDNGTCRELVKEFDLV